MTVILFVLDLAAIRPAAWPPHLRGGDRKEKTSVLTDERRLSQVSSAPHNDLQELVFFVHHVVLLLQGDPHPVQAEKLPLQLIPTCGKWKNICTKTNQSINQSKV